MGRIKTEQLNHGECIQLQVYDRFTIRHLMRHNHYKFTTKVLHNQCSGDSKQDQCILGFRSMNQVEE
jgi:hypothetical protein